MRDVAGRVCGVSRDSSLALSPQRHMGIDTALLQCHQVRLVAATRIGQHTTSGCPSKVSFTSSSIGHQMTRGAGVRIDLRRHNELLLPIDHDLCVVTLLEPIGRCLHDLALGVGEVALRLRLGFPIGTLVRPAPLGRALLAGLAPSRVIDRTLRRLQPRLRLLNRRQTLLASSPLRRQLVTALRLTVALVLLGIDRAQLGPAVLESLPSAAPPLFSIRLSLIALRLLASARTFVPSTDNVPKRTQPISRATRTPSTNTPSNSSR